jgi:hypothetical protein
MLAGFGSVVRRYAPENFSYRDTWGFSCSSTFCLVRSCIIQIRLFRSFEIYKTLKWNTAARLPAWIMSRTGSIFPPLASLFSPSPNFGQLHKRLFVSLIPAGTLPAYMYALGTSITRRTTKLVQRSPPSLPRACPFLFVQIMLMHPRYWFLKPAHYPWRCPLVSSKLTPTESSH